ncbi:multidrug transporter [Candidatus Phytoplasma meliae]|uniref:Multidrug-efflux transporter n=1 Tax=Candidatus Phytoplasma meliae TaxID=1848402 RepID=A0ABS5CXR5_9MOLU|nr:multidrug transporter [Candidatus Phytoplasma meliae]MBP5835760.1 multidrug transporter [Candidatus Phytoplasma meliae]
MKQEQELLGKKEKLNKLVLEGNLIKSLWIISLPIIVFNVFKSLFANVDTLFAVGSVNPKAIGSFIQFSKSIQVIIDSIGICLGITGVTLVTREVGRNKNVYTPKARQIVSSVFVLLILVSFVVAFIMVICAEPFCNNIMGLSKYVLNGSLSLDDQKKCIFAFRLKMLGVILLAINVFFLGTERILRKIKKILILNCVMMALKIGLSFFIFYVMKQQNALGLEIASVLAHASITLVAFGTLFNKNNPFCLKIKDFSCKSFLANQQITKTILKFAIPLMLGKMLYEFGRLLTLWMIESDSDNPFCGFKGLGVGTLGKIGVADGVVGLFAQISFALKEGQLMIVSANLGNKNIKRAIKTLVISCISVLLIFMITYLICAPTKYYGLGLGEYIYLFFKNLGKTTKATTPPEGFSEFLMGALLTTGLITTQLEILSIFLIATKQPKYDLFLSFGRVFLFRIPFLYLLRAFVFQPATANEYYVYSTANFFSNLIMFLFMLFFCCRSIAKIKKNETNDILDKSAYKKNV